MLDEYINYIFVENLLTSVIIIFVLFYVYSNMDIVSNGDYFNGSITNPIIYTCIIVIIGLILVDYNGYDKKIKQSFDNEIVILSEQNIDDGKTYKIIKKEKNIFIQNNNKHLFGLNM